MLVRVKPDAGIYSYVQNPTFFVVVSGISFACPVINPAGNICILLIYFIYYRLKFL
jgi:protein-S-isoprenylcysteine O-methyltransferase Ste14